MSDPAGWSRIEAALDELLALPQAQRPDALARLAGDDAAMRAELELLLAETVAADSLLDLPAVAAYQPEARPQGSLAAGARLGAWRIAGLIGRGGMGEVYRAERADGQFEQQVALKLIRSDAAAEPRRFTAERQILARLEHPGIARLLDGGVAPDGRPYMVMELVSGAAITEWCRARDADLEQRLTLFMAACEAVAYAHRNLVIHRDLKPGNVMVTAEGAVKLLDFGIAKLVDAEGVDAEQTRYAPVTLGYAAPEQLAGGAVTTAADVYALGMLLLELLTGRRPWSLSELSMPAALDKLLRESPPPPSRLAARSMEPPVPPRLLRGDLDAIVARALRREPEKRYATVEALREDVARHLAGEAVAAREGARLYAFSRFVGRNRLMVAAALAVLLAIVGGSLGIAWQARRTEAEARKATAVRDFLVGIFKVNDLNNPDGARARATTAEQMLDLGARRIDTDLQDVPEVKAELLGTIGGLYADLDLSQRAIPLLQHQVDILRAHGESQAQLAEALAQLGGAQTVAGRYTDAERTLNDALAGLKKSDEQDSVARARALLYLSQIALRNRAATDPLAEQYAQDSLHILETAHPEDSLRIAVLIQLGRIGFWREDFAMAEPHFKQALALLQAPQFRAYRSEMAGVHLDYGDMLQRAARYDEAEVELRQAIDQYLTQIGADYPQTLRAQEDLAGALFESGRLAEARPLMTSTLTAFERVRGVDDLEWTMDARIYLARLLLARGEFEAANRLFEQSENILRAAAPSSAFLPIALRWQAEVLTAQGRYKEAEQVLGDAEIGFKNFFGEHHLRMSGVLLAKADLLLEQGQGGEAAALYKRILSEWPQREGRPRDHFIYASLGLARVWLEEKRFSESAAQAKGILDAIHASSQSDTFAVQEARICLVLGEALRGEGDLPTSMTVLRRALVLREKMDDPASPWLAEVRAELALDMLDAGDTAGAQALLSQASTAEAAEPRLAARFRKPLEQARIRARHAASLRSSAGDV
jgi:tetratricopeptide (TPR) repeat protein